MNRDVFEEMESGEAGEWILRFIDSLKDAIADAEQRLGEPGAVIQQIAWRLFREAQAVTGVRE
ncbi:hypothetical protein BH11CYA1_BH11CYA1_36280 [soil metagenome]